MDYKQTLHYLFEQLPMFQRIGPAAFKKDLSNIIKLCDLLSNPQQKFKTIHIAGTNGKGSVSHIIAAVLQAHGYKVGLYTSPHYKDFRERIKINGDYITEEAVVDFVEVLNEEFDTLKPSFFEITVAMAFDYFAKQKVDFAVIETGLGGRLDSTNILKPEISVITNIGYDHTQFLGDTLPLIASEKAGIIKDNTPVVIGETQEEIKLVFEEFANKKNAPICFAENDYKLEQFDEEKTLFRNEQPILSNFKIDLKGLYQTKNIVTAIAALHVLQQHNLVDLQNDATKDALANVRGLTGFIGRWQQISDEPRIIVDSAHNEAGVKALLNSLKEIDYKHLHIVWGGVKDKDHSPSLKLLPKTANYYFCKPDIPRGLEANKLNEIALKAGLMGNSFLSAKDALNAAKKQYKIGDLILVSGSIFVVAEVL